MSYAVNGLIEATDYNNLAGSNPTDVANTMNRVWGIGSGTSGYGQTAIGNVVNGNTVTASQWATLINSVNNSRKHQSGPSYTNLTTPTAGDTVNYVSTLQSRITDAYTNRLSFNATRGTTITGSSDENTFGEVIDTNVFNSNRVATVTFGSSDQARYFFNAGGALSFFCAATDLAGTNRSNALQAVIGIPPTAGMQYLSTFAANGNGGPYAASSVDLTKGYYQGIYGTWTQLAISYNNAPYGSTYAQIVYDAGSSDTTRNSKGNIVRFRLNMYAPADPGGGSIIIKTTCRVDILPPETTYLSNSWGTPSITWSTI